MIEQSKSSIILLGMATCVALSLHLKIVSLNRQILGMKKQEQNIKDSAQKNGENTGTKNETNSAPTPQTTDYTMKEIGIITSPYPQRAGTPRQGLIAQHSRSILTLHDGITKECLEDITQYSHVWVIFQFHLNPIGKGKDKNAFKNSKSKQQQNRKASSPFQFSASKIKPPRANGRRVSVFATRSPHRPNNVGLSLAMVEDVKVSTQNIVIPNSNGKKKVRKKIQLKLLGLDLVDGTPVYDIKPMCPSDVIPLDHLRVPDWVSADDQLSAVKWTDDAKASINNFQKMGLLEPLYPAKEISSKHGENDDVIKAISEIVGQDPRAQHEGRGNTMEDCSTYEITFSTLRVKFRVESSQLTTANHFAKIVEVVEDEGDETAQPGSYQHSLGMRRRAEREARKKGLKLLWKYPIREGITTGIYDLRDGSQYSFE